jgi:hypothetical protein
MQSWADVTDNGDLVLDWNEVIAYSGKFDRGYRTNNAALAKMISIIQREAWERGFHDGVVSQGHERSLFLTGGNG